MQEMLTALDEAQYRLNFRTLTVCFNSRVQAPQRGRMCATLRVYLNHDDNVDNDLHCDDAPQDDRLIPRGRPKNEAQEDGE